MTTKPFNPHYGSGLKLAVTDISASQAISNHNEAVRLCNAGPGVAYVKIGAGPQVAEAVKDFAVLPNETVTIAKRIGDSGLNPVQLAAVCEATGTATLYVIVGNGGV
jgi:hypothetical protein